MQQFFIIAAAHFLALLSPGPDFFLILRSSLASGWRVASGACLGVALSNGVFIVAALAGVSALKSGSFGFQVLQWAGSLYLLYLGLLFIRHAGRRPLAIPSTIATIDDGPVAYGAAAAWWRATATGFLTGILNPKNALFYASLAAMLSPPHDSTGWKLLYGTWMFTVVLFWDLLVAISIGHPRILRRFARVLPWFERASGAMLILLGLGIVVMQIRG